MNKINYVCGDLFAAINSIDRPVVIPHVCNNQGAWGAGFVIPLARHFPVTRERYLAMNPHWGIEGEAVTSAMVQELAGQPFFDEMLGKVGFVKMGNILVCNMIAQELGGNRPLFYNHLATCMMKVRRHADKRFFDAKHQWEIHAPAFGSGLAGGNWTVINGLIEDCWLRGYESPSPPVTIYYLPGTFTPPV